MQGKGDFFLVTFSDHIEPPNQEIVERERLRPAYGHNLAIFEKVLFPIKADLQVRQIVFIFYIPIEKFDVGRPMSKSRRIHCLKWQSWCDIF